MKLALRVWGAEPGSNGTGMQVQTLRYSPLRMGYFFLQKQKIPSYKMTRWGGGQAPNQGDSQMYCIKEDQLLPVDRSGVMPGDFCWVALTTASSKPAFWTVSKPKWCSGSALFLSPCLLGGIHHLPFTAVSCRWPVALSLPSPTPTPLLTLM